MYLILQQDKPEDLVIATGVSTEVREFVIKAFKETGIELEFQGNGPDEKAYIFNCEHPDYQLEKGKCVLEVDPGYFRPTEVDILIGDSSRAKEILGWEPEYDLDDLVKDMMASDINLMKKEQFLKNGGFKIMNYYE